MIRPMRVALGAGALALGAASIAIIVTSGSSGGEVPIGTTVLANENVRPWSCPAGTPLTANCLYVSSSIDPTVQIFVIRVDTEGAQGAPLLVLGDGPGEALSDTLRDLVPLGREMGRDLVVIDPPGAGRSRPSLGCPELTLDPSRPSLSETQFEEAVAACHDRLAAASVDLTVSTTTSTTDRIEDVRRALGVETWAVWAGGENSRLALELARRSGPSVMEALVLTSPLTGEYNPYIDAQTPAVTALVEACADDVTCRERFGDLEAILGAAVADLAENPFVLASGTAGAARAQRVLASDALIGLSLVIADDAQRPSVPRLISTSIAAGDWTEVAKAMAGAGTDDQAVGSLLGRRCAEDAGRVSDGAQELLRQNTPGWSALFEGLGAVELCSPWEAATVSDPVAASDGVAVPTLILRGQFDPVSRVDDGQALADALTGSVLAELSGIGGNPLASDCGRRITVGFLMTPTTPPDVSCAEAAAQSWVS